VIKFIDKLIEETQQGILDYVWEFTQGNKFKYNEEKHPLKDLTFSLDDVVMKEITKESGKTKIVLDETKGQIVFPNGAGMIVDKSKLEILNSLCHDAILRAMGNTASRYANGTIQAEIAAAKAKAEADKKKKEQESKTTKSEEKPTNEKQPDKKKV
jgi:ribosomal protein L12E/L44/L45/RPP1/RPP2